LSGFFDPGCQPLGLILNWAAWLRFAAQGICILSFLPTSSRSAIKLEAANALPSRIG
jgi:hypothetical protein